jgi:AAA domain
VVRICYEFSRKGTCKYKKCKFPHIRGDQQKYKPPSKPTKSYDDLSSSEKEFRAWRSNIPLNNKSASRALRSKLTSIFQEARRLIDIDVGVRQSVIQTLSGEGGLSCIKEMIEQLFEELGGVTIKEHRFKVQIFPLLEIISHPDVVDSLILEHSVGTIYNFLFGINGVRASKLLSYISEVLPNCTKDESTAIWVEVSLFVFCRIVDLNSTAHVQESLKDCARQFEQILITWVTKGPENPLYQARVYMERLLRRFHIGSSLPTMTQQNQTQVAKTPGAFVAEREPPGGRHDNDHPDICQIRVMPSYQEISSPRIEYLPVYDPTQWHLDGLNGLLDRNFRLLREDTIGLLRDAIHSEIRPSPVVRNQKQNQQRTNVYHGAKIHTLGFDQMDGFQFEVIFSQPAKVAAMPAAKREEWWKMSKRLQSGALVCLITKAKYVLFCTVAESQRPPHKRQGQTEKQQKNSNLLWKDPIFSAVTLQLTEARNKNIEIVLRQYILKEPCFALVEFPGVLLPAFEPTLKALQLMKRNGNLPLSELLLPSSANSAGPTHISPPLYAMKPGFQFNLRCLMNDKSDFYVHPSQPANIQKLCQNSDLDDAQATALVETLQRKIGLIQGPPGTGKSYTGISLIKVLLANKKHGKTRLGPIICVTYTNHALDQLLESLVQNEVTKQIIRIGSQSKSEILAPYRLREIARNIDKTKIEKSGQWASHRSLEGCEKEFDTIRLRGGVSPDHVMIHLRKHHLSHYNQLFGVEEDDYQQANSDNVGKVFKRWRMSGNRATYIRSVEELESIRLVHMSQPEREALYAHWKMEIQTEMQKSLIRICEAHRDTKREFDNIRNEVDLRCLGQADVIGVTTSGLARNLNMLRRLQSKVVLCEEAGEVLESHLLTALLPSVEQAIFIGDHLQLRPQVQNHELSRENKHGGERYSLDVSLFERLIESDSTMGSSLPYSTLQTQRRMHPSIAQLVRDTLYPQLQDASSVHEYPGISGVRKRLFWLDHRVPEANPSNEEAAATSRWNDYEVDMTTALVSHLIRQGKYSSGDIAVLTPYLGQLHRLRRRLGQSYAITVGDRDQDDLDKAGFENELTTSNTTGVRATLLQSLRVATIDNFQGEEASVVVISLVRSNPQNRCGFLRTSNRINVLLSRAKHGMYIIGNSMTSIHVPMWADVIEILRRNEKIGPGLELQCPRHPDTPITVSDPDDFPRLSPEGGCNLRCVNRLSCGHACVQKCHSEMLHDAVYCLEPCQRSRKGCDHPCPVKCGDKCPSKCMVKVFQKDRRLDCGHLIETLPCWQSQDLSTVRCPVPVKKTVPDCTHEVTVACHVDIASPKYKCTAQCRTVLACGHSCKNQCFECVARSDSGEVHTDHGYCKQQCGRNQSTCAHTCKTPCHGEEPCPPCQSPCDVHCGHSRCAQKCSDPCTPCAEGKCLSSCPHSACTMPCAAPCDHVPCSMRCDRLLACGHQCPSLCGEICPHEKYCQTCGTQDIKDHTVDFILGETYKEIDLDENPCIFPQCGHFLTIENMDSLMDLQKYYILDAREKPVGIAASLEPLSIDDIKRCASCRGPLRDISRYGRLVRRAILDESTKKLILYMNREYVPLAQELPLLIQQLQEKESSRYVVWPATITVKGERLAQVKYMGGIISATNNSRWKDILGLRQRIERYQKQVAPDEQPYSRVRNMVINSRRQHKTTGSFDFGNEILQTKGCLQAAALSLRLDIALLADFLKLRRDTLTGSQGTFEMDLSHIKDECEALIKTASESKRITHQTEGYIFMAQAHALERSQSALPEVAEQHLTQGKEAIDRARTLCTSYPGQTRGLEDEVAGAEKMLNGGTFYTTVTNEERMEVIAAMAREFSGTGHWYYCRNGHPFTIGECGMAMQRSVCPECSEPVGGQHHTAVEGVTHARDLEGAFQGMNLN